MQFWLITKLKESGKKDKYLDLAKELKKKLWKSGVGVIRIEAEVFGTVSKGWRNQKPNEESRQFKARIDKTQQNSKCRLCGDRDETINHIINEYTKLAQKE